MIYEDIVSKKEYEVNGEKKVVWLKCGTLRTNEQGKRFIELNIIPNIPLYVFPKKEKQEKSSGDTWSENER